MDITRRIIELSILTAIFKNILNGSFFLTDVLSRLIVLFSRLFTLRLIAVLEKICNEFWIPENIRFTVNADAQVLQKV